MSARRGSAPSAPSRRSTRLSARVPDGAASLPPAIPPSISSILPKEPANAKHITHQFADFVLSQDAETRAAMVLVDIAKKQANCAPLVVQQDSIPLGAHEIDVVVPTRYFGLVMQEQQSRTPIVCIDCPVTAAEQRSFDANPLLRDLTLVMTGQANPKASYTLLIKAVAVALHGSLRFFSEYHLGLQVKNPRFREIASSTEAAEDEYVVEFVRPRQRGQNPSVRSHVQAADAPLDDEEREALERRKATTYKALVRIGTKYPKSPYGALYKAVGQVMKKFWPPPQEVPHTRARARVALQASSSVNIPSVASSSHI